MAEISYNIDDLEKIATGAAIIGSGGGGSYDDALDVIEQMRTAVPGFKAIVETDFDDSKGSAMVLAMEGSPNAGSTLNYSDIMTAITNTQAVQVQQFGKTTNYVIPVEVGALNSLIPLLAAGAGLYPKVIDGDGAGRAVPQLTDLIFGVTGNAPLSCGPGMLANASATDIQTAVLNGNNAAEVEDLTRGVVSDSFGSLAGLAAWCSLPNGGYNGNFIKGTMGTAWSLGDYLLSASTPPSTADVAAKITSLTGQPTQVLLANGKLVDVSETTSGGFDAGVATLTGTDQKTGTPATFTIYNLNENLLCFSDQQTAPVGVAPDLIMFYSETTGFGFSNAQNDLEKYLNTGSSVSLIRMKAYPQMYATKPVMDSWTSLLRDIGFAGAMPTATS